MKVYGFIVAAHLVGAAVAMFVAHTMVAAAPSLTRVLAP
jgi:hypothetical protein